MQVLILIKKSYGVNLTDLFDPFQSLLTAIVSTQTVFDPVACLYPRLMQFPDLLPVDICKPNVRVYGH